MRIGDVILTAWLALTCTLLPRAALAQGEIRSSYGFNGRTARATACGLNPRGCDRGADFEDLLSFPEHLTGLEAAAVDRKWRFVVCGLRPHGLSLAAPEGSAIEQETGIPEWKP